MIKKILGIVIAVLAIVVIVMAVMHRGKYASLVFEKPEAEAIFEATTAEERAIPATDPLKSDSATRNLDTVGSEPLSGSRRTAADPSTRSAADTVSESHRGDTRNLHSGSK